MENRGYPGTRGDGKKQAQGDRDLWDRGGVWACEQYGQCEQVIDSMTEDCRPDTTAPHSDDSQPQRQWKYSQCVNRTEVGGAE